MKTIRFAVVFALFVSGLVTSTFSQTEDESAILQQEVGKWKAELKMWIAGPDSEPMTFEGVETNEMLGENWVLTNFEGNFGGTEFKGHGVFGYDLRKEKFISTWVDSVNGFMSTAEGSYDPETKMITTSGKDLDPMSGELVDGRQTKEVKEDGSRVATMYVKPDGSDDYVKMMEITYTRKDDSPQKSPKK